MKFLKKRSIYFYIELGLLVSIAVVICSIFYFFYKDRVDTAHAGSSKFLISTIVDSTGKPGSSSIFACTKSEDSIYGKLYRVDITVDNSSQSLPYFSYAVYRPDPSSDHGDLDAVVNYFDNQGNLQTNYFNNLPQIHQSMLNKGQFNYSFYASANLGDQFYFTMTKYPQTIFSLASFTGQNGTSTKSLEDHVAFQEGLVNPKYLPVCTKGNVQAMPSVYTGDASKTYVYNRNEALSYSNIIAKNGPFILKMTLSGNLKLYNNSSIIWSSNTSGNVGDYAVMQQDGNFVLYNEDATKVLWSTGTSGNPGANLTISDQGFLNIQDSSGNIKFTTKPPDPPTGPSSAQFPSGNNSKTYSNNQSILSNNGFNFVMQSDGNAVEYFDGFPVFSTGTSGNPGAYAALQPDGNFTINNISNNCIWASNTMSANGSGGGSIISLDNNGIINITSSNGDLLWPLPPPTTNDYSYYYLENSPGSFLSNDYSNNQIPNYWHFRPSNFNPPSWVQAPYKSKNFTLSYDFSVSPSHANYQLYAKSLGMGAMGASGIGGGEEGESGAMVARALAKLVANGTSVYN
jgi:hypothetical protein